MENTPIIVSILFSMAAMIMAAIVVARNEDHSADLRRRIAAVKIELEKVSKEHRDISLKTQEAHRAVAALEKAQRAEIDLLKSDHTDSIAVLTGKLAELASKLPERGSPKRS